MSRIVRTRQAQTDLIEIWRYIAIDQQSPEAADALLRGFDETLCTLLLQPLIGPSVERIRPGLRLFPRGSYIIFLSAPSRWPPGLSSASWRARLGATDPALSDFYNIGVRGRLKSNGIVLNGQ